MRRNQLFRGRRGRTVLGFAVVVAALATTAAMAGLGFASSSISAAQYQYGGKLTICHHTHSKTNAGVTITISVHAWPAHRRRGDTLGPCASAPTAPSGPNAPSEPGHGRGQGHDEGADSASQPAPAASPGGGGSHAPTDASDQPSGATTQPSAGATGGRGHDGGDSGGSPSTAGSGGSPSTPTSQDSPGNSGGHADGGNGAGHGHRS